MGRGGGGRDWTGGKRWRSKRLDWWREDEEAGERTGGKRWRRKRKERSDGERWRRGVEEEEKEREGVYTFRPVIFIRDFEL